MASVHRPRARERIALALLAVLSVAACASTPPVVPLQPSPIGRVATPSEQVLALVGLGDRARREGRLTDGVAYYEQALSLEPRNPALLVRYGDLLGELDRHADALDALQRAVELSPDDASANLAYAQALLTVGRVDDARGFIDKALVLRPGDREALIAQGVAADLQGRHEEASESYRRALERAPGDPAALGNLALSRALAGDASGAMAAARQLPGDDPAAAAMSAMVASLLGESAVDPRFGADPGFQRNLEQLRALAAREPAAPATGSAWDVVAPAAPPARPASESPADTPVRATALPEPAAGPQPVPTSDPARSAAPASAEPAAAIATGADTTDAAWVVRIGHYASDSEAAAAWQSLRRQLPGSFARTPRLAGGSSAQPIILGPLGSPDQAAALCDALPAGTSCETSAL
jgi:Flp pilus assembly protein TadD